MNHPDEINSIFDTISYAKGASVIYMLSTYLGDEVFMGGIQKYTVTAFRWPVTAFC